MFQENQKLSEFYFEQEEYPSSKIQFEFENRDFFTKLQNPRTNELASPNLECPFKGGNILEDDAESFLCFRPKSLSTTDDSNWSCLSVEGSSKNRNLLSKKKICPEIVKLDFNFKVSNPITKSKKPLKKNLSYIKSTHKQKLIQRKARRNLKQLLRKKKDLFQGLESSEEETDIEGGQPKSSRSSRIIDSENLLKTILNEDGDDTRKMRNNTKKFDILFDNIPRFQSANFLVNPMEEALRRHHKLICMTQTMKNQEEKEFNEQRLSSIAIAIRTSKIMNLKAAESSAALSKIFGNISGLKNQFKSSIEIDKISN